MTDTVRRLRLHRAATELITGELPLPRIARRAGYGSQEAFTRAFKVAYGVPPGRYRASFIPTALQRRAEDAMETMKYDVTIREQSAIRVAALQHRGDYANIGNTFERLAAIAAGQGLFGPTTKSYGIYYDDPKASSRTELRADACITVPADWVAHGGLELREIPAGRYAVVRHVGPYAELERPYGWMYGTWLPQSGEEPANAPVVEQYLNDARTVPQAALETEICLPLA